MPKVSVLMPVYNVKEEYLRESIESILHQTFNDFEFIILDDCSKNDVESIVNSYKDTRIRFYRNDKNLKVSACRNKLLDLSNSEYVAFQDADDISYAERLKVQVEYLERHRDVSILSAAYETYPNGKVVSHCRNVKYFDLLKECCVAQPVVIMRLSSIRYCNLKYSEEFDTSEDYEFWSRAIKYLKIENLTNVLLKYRIRENSLSHSDTELIIKNDMRIREAMFDFLTSDELLKNYLKYTFLKSYFKRKNSCLENIFSIRNIDREKVLTIMGRKVRIKSL